MYKNSNLEFVKDEDFLSKFKNDDFGKSLVDNWKGSVVGKESTFHQIAPYIGKMKSSMARELISTFTSQSEIVYDPFCGSGTIAFEAWVAHRQVIANDLNPYAFIITNAKLFPFFSLNEAMIEINILGNEVKELISSVNLRKIPNWVRSFFHPDTLREIIAWVRVLKLKKSYFLLSCLLGILHHQRPGFLSYPSSHTVPYLRQKKFPEVDYPELYEYRSVRDRLEKKVTRTFKRVPQLNKQIIRECHNVQAIELMPKYKINAIITSPPYMRKLDYGRDNRLRLWFLGKENWRSLDKIISPSESNFINLFKSCLKLWRHILAPKGLCVLVLGDAWSGMYKMSMPDLIIHLATQEIGGYSVYWNYSEIIPCNRRVRRYCSGNLKETILVLRNDKEI